MDKFLIHIDSAFEAFYSMMLQDEKMSIFFTDQNQIIDLIYKQKNHFRHTLHLSPEEREESFFKLGSYHYKINIPYVDFMKGSEILEQYFLSHIDLKYEGENLIAETIKYFEIMKEFTARGYLNCMLEEDKQDIDIFFLHLNDMKETPLYQKVIIQKISRLRYLIECIQTDAVWEEDDSHLLLQQWLDESKELTPEKRHFFEQLQQRVSLNRLNLFYFLKRKEYREILPLYSSLLTIYKLAFMMHNVMSIEHTNQIMKDMRIDSLTGLLRKDYFKETLHQEMDFVDRNPDEYFSVAYIDIDNFKMVNDYYGHYSGDKVLEKLGKIIKDNIRSTDIGFRIGGDEFVILFRHITKKEAIKACKKILKHIATFDFIFSKKQKFHVTLSIGIQKYTIKYKHDYQKFVKKGDKKLYKAKKLGKNTIV